jgi:hypothetical protein
MFNPGMVGATLLASRLYLYHVHVTLCICMYGVLVGFHILISHPHHGTCMWMLAYGMHVIMVMAGVVITYHIIPGLVLFVH